MMTNPVTQATQLGAWLTARGWLAEPDYEDPAAEINTWAWPKADHTYQGSMIETQIIALGRGDVAVIYAHPDAMAAVDGVATKRMTGDACRQIIDDIESYTLTDAEASRWETLAAEVMEAPEVQDAIRAAVARITDGTRLGGLMVSRAGDEVRLIIDDVHVIGVAVSMGTLADVLENLPEGGVGGSWHDKSDGVGIERRESSDETNVVVNLVSSRYGCASCTLTMPQALELADVLRDRQ